MKSEDRLVAALELVSVLLSSLFTTAENTPWSKVLILTPIPAPPSPRARAFIFLHSTYHPSMYYILDLFILLVLSLQLECKRWDCKGVCLFHSSVYLYAYERLLDKFMCSINFGKPMNYYKSLSWSICGTLERSPYLKSENQAPGLDLCLQA